MRPTIILAALAIFFVFPSLLMAHPGHVASDGFYAGFMHPFMGVDHIVSMLLVGAWSMAHRGKMLWAGPGSFLVGAAGGLGLGAVGFAWGALDHWLAISVLVIGLIVAALQDLPKWLVLGLFAVFGGLHGQAHVDAAAMSWASGVAFLTASFVLHGLGALLVSCISRDRERSWVRGAGFVSAGFGLVLFATVVV